MYRMKFDPMNPAPPATRSRTPFAFIRPSCPRSRGCRCRADGPGTRRASRAGAGIVEHHLHHPLDHAEMVGLALVVVPGLDDAGVSGGEVDLSELLEHLLVAAQDLHEPSPLVGDHLELLDHHALDHLPSSK